MITIPRASVMADEIANLKLTQIDRESSVLAASKLMRKSGVTELLVTDESSGMMLPLGIVTADDIVSRVVAAELDPAVLTTGDIAWPRVAGTEAQGIQSGKLSRTDDSQRGTLAVVDGDGRLIGTVRLEELIGARQPTPDFEPVHHPAGAGGPIAA